MPTVANYGAVCYHNNMHKLFAYVSAAVILTILFGTVYLTEQRSLRMNANDSIIQLAQGAAAKLNAGASPSSLTIGNVNMASSLAPFLIIYNTIGRVVAGSGYLHGSIPVIPFEVLAPTNTTRESLVTWQPAAGVRDATDTVAANHYYVLSGWSLREVESSQAKVFKLTLLGWLASLIVLLLTAFILYPRKHHRSHHHPASA